MSTCHKCGTENPEDANFCSRCGTRMVHYDAGDTTVSFEPDDTSGSRPPSRPSGKGGAYPLLLIRSGGGREGEEILLDADLLTIGRDPESHLFLDDVTVSRHHARVVRAAAGLVVEDLNSLNGTYVNRSRIERHQLADGDDLQIGKFKLAFLEPTDE